MIWKPFLMPNTWNVLRTLVITILLFFGHTQYLVDEDGNPCDNYTDDTGWVSILYLPLTTLTGTFNFFFNSDFEGDDCTNVKGIPPPDILMIFGALMEMIYVYLTSCGLMMLFSFVKKKVKLWFT